MNIRYTGVAGASVSNDHGAWNVNAPRFLPGEVDGKQVPHPYSPVKDVPDEAAKAYLKTALFEKFEEDAAVASSPTVTITSKEEDDNA